VIVACGHEDDEEGSMVAVEVVARAAGRTEHSRVPVARKQRPHHGQLEPLARFRVPDEEATRPQARAAEEDAAMASVERLVWRRHSAGDAQARAIRV